MIPRRVLIKLGGSSLQNEGVLAKLVDLVKCYKNAETDVFIVHGGGPAINAELTKKGITWNFLEGQRITTPEMIDTIEMVLKGYINSKVVRALNQGELSATGVSGAENTLLLCEQAKPELQCVGRITSVNVPWVEAISALGTVPVIAPLGVGKAGEVYNINADWAAAQIAMALKVNELIYLTDQKGIWDANKAVLKNQSATDLQNLIDSQVVQGGMLAKTQTIIAALKNGIHSIRILHAEDAVEGYNQRHLGTTCTLNILKESSYVAL